MNKLDICKSTRKIAADSLLKVLIHILNSNKKVSEADLRDAWLEELRKYKEIFPDGWYIPPAHGIGILFATDKNFERSNYTTLRKEKYWPRNDVFLDREKGILMPYASPVSRDGIIGDFGLDLYLGKNENIRKHFKNIYEKVNKLFTDITIGMKLSDLFHHGYKIFSQNNLINEGWLSTTDPTGINIGHTIPMIEKKLLQEKDWSAICKTISSARKFINAVEKTVIKPGIAFTLEPRLKSIKDPTLPTIYFHTIALIHENGEKELLTNFDEIFKLTGMDYML